MTRQVGLFLAHCITLVGLVFGKARRGRNSGFEASNDGELRVLLLGPFKLKNWVDAYCLPLRLARPDAQITAVVDEYVDSSAEVRMVVTPKALQRVFGRYLSRFIYCSSLSIFWRPTHVVAFHLPLNGIAGIVCATLCRSKAIYFNVGCDAEIAQGGNRSESWPFHGLNSGSDSLKSRLTEIARCFDLCLTMGNKSAEYLRNLPVDKPIFPVSVGLDPCRFDIRQQEKRWHLITVCRLVRDKRVDRFLHVASLIMSHVPDLKCLVVGDGPERHCLENLARKLAIDVCFVGWTERVEMLLGQAQLFCLLSDHEGLPISMLEAMFSGLPVVATDVGDIRDAIDDEENGLLIDLDENEDSIAKRIAGLLTSPEILEAMGDRARQSASNSYSARIRSQYWDEALRYDEQDWS